MTYGDCLDQLRTALTTLLNHPRPTSLPDAPAVGRYRDSVLVWCREAVEEASRTDRIQVTRHAFAKQPIEEFRRRIHAVAAQSPEPPLSALLSTEHSDSLLVAWQQAARAAVVGERELLATLAWPAPANRNWLVIKDAADIARAVVALDARYGGLDGYVGLRHRTQLGVAAVATSAIAGDGPLDHRADGIGWQPPPRPAPVSASGLASVVQSQHNTAVHLRGVPAARDMRHILLTQARFSRDAALSADAVSSPSASDLHERTRLYRQLLAAARDVDGLIGGPDGKHAVTSSVDASLRMATIRRNGGVKSKDLLQLVEASQFVDHHLGTAIRRGLDSGIYLVPSRKAIGAPGSGGVAPAVVARWRPAYPTEPVQLRKLVESHLPAATEPEPVAPHPSRNDRQDFNRIIAEHGIRTTSPTFWH